jgi:purine-binding chemotaxis protein CheW
MTGNTNVELATFYIGDALFGVDILKVEEINKIQLMTKVPQAPAYVLGVMNLRGKIVTIIDLCMKLGLSAAEISDASRIIIVNSRGESSGLLVDRVEDVVPVDKRNMSAPPANVSGVQGMVLLGVYRTDRSLIAILNVEAVLDVEQL